MKMGMASGFLVSTPVWVLERVLTSMPCQAGVCVHPTCHQASNRSVSQRLKSGAPADGACTTNKMVSKDFKSYVNQWEKESEKAYHI